ncbi:hypothetical protein [Kineococcus sp. SYSU DK006]|uniref:hypothetical protein n=1 Tax=Kineococcus sp. SYSU DK006 TaxID=3383127 RepID=UPI003D7DDD21
MSAEEELALQVRAGALGVSVPRLLVEAALADGAPGDPRASKTAGSAAGAGTRGVTPGERAALARELLAVRQLLLGVTNNVNQLTRRANAAAAAGSRAVVDLPEGAGPALAVVRRVTQRLDVAVQTLIEP